MNLSDISVISHSVGGLTPQGSVYEESQVSVDVCPKSLVVYVYLGANDLGSLHYPDPNWQFQCLVSGQIYVTGHIAGPLVVAHAFHRTSRRRHDFNYILPEYNHYLKSLCKNHPSSCVIFFHGEMSFHNWELCLLPDTVHFNSTGIQREMIHVAATS